MFCPKKHIWIIQMGDFFKWHGTAAVKKQCSYEIRKVEAEDSSLYIITTNNN